MFHNVIILFLCNLFIFIPPPWNDNACARQEEKCYCQGSADNLRTGHVSSIVRIYWLYWLVFSIQPFSSLCIAARSVCESRVPSCIIMSFLVLVFLILTHCFLPFFLFFFFFFFLCSFSFVFFFCLFLFFFSVLVLEPRCRLLSLEGDILGCVEGDSSFEASVLADSSKRLPAMCDVQVSTASDDAKLA